MVSFVVTACLAPADAAGQEFQPGHQAFARGVLALTAALEGARGDEGPRVLAAIASMADALAEWDRDVQRLEAELAAAAVRGAPLAEVARRQADLGWEYAERGRLADALDAFERASQADPRAPEPHLLRGLVQVRRDPVDAAAAFQQAWELDRDNPVTAYWAVQSARAAGAAGDTAPAVETLVAAYRRIVEREGSTVNRPFLQRTLFHDDAAEVPLFPLVAYQEGYARLVAREYDAALVSLRTAAVADPLVIDAALRAEPAAQGIAALRQGRPAAAVDPLERAAAMAPASSDVRRLLGIAYRAVGRLDEAVARLEDAVRLDARNERASIELVSVLTDAGQRARARGALDEAIQRHPTSGSLRWMYAVLYRQLNDEGGMLRQLEAIPTSGMLAGRGQVWGAIGLLHLAVMQAPAAERPFRDAVLAVPNNAAAHLDLGELYRTEGVVGPALASFVAALLIAPAVAEAHTAIGQIFLAGGRGADAVVAFRRAVALSPDHPDARYGLASALLQVGEADQAAPHLEAFGRLARRRADDLRANYELFGLKREAAFDHDEGRYAEAVAGWRAVVDREPGLAENHVELGESLAGAGELDLAIQALERATALNAADDVYRRLAELYAARGLEEASARARAEYERRQADAYAARRRQAGQ